MFVRNHHWWVAQSCVEKSSSCEGIPGGRWCEWRGMRAKTESLDLGWNQGLPIPLTATNITDSFLVHHSLCYVWLSASTPNGPSQHLQGLL